MKSKHNKAIPQILTSTLLPFPNYTHTNTKRKKVTVKTALRQTLPSERRSGRYKEQSKQNKTKDKWR